MKAIMLDAVLLFPGVGHGINTSILGHSRVKGRFPYSNERCLWREFLKKTHSADIWRIMSGSGGDQGPQFALDPRRGRDEPAHDTPPGHPKNLRRPAAGGALRPQREGR